ncbi:MAG TPA: OsmC family protein, partial [Candidatus Acidoferrales bacterium]
LVAAVSGCLMSTFMAIAEMNKLTVEFYHARAFGRLEKIPGEGYRFTEFVLAPDIGVDRDDVEKALKVMAKAEKNCFISNSLRATVQVEPKFVSAPVEVTP